MAEKFSKIKKNLLIVTIGVVLVFFIAIGISTFYKSPKYEDYCNTEYRSKTYPLKISEECGVFNPPKDLQNECTPKKGYIQAEYDEKGCINNYYCETCQKNFDDTNKIYERNVFVIALIFGLLSLIVGIFLRIESVSSGIMGGGLLTIIYSVIRYWSELLDYWRFIILGITLAILIWVGFKKFRK